MLERCDISYHLRRAIISTYATSESAVSSGTCENLWFETTTGVRQGSKLSPLLFIMYFDCVIKEVAGEQPSTSVLAYADDITQTRVKGTCNNILKCGTDVLTNMGLSST